MFHYIYLRTDCCRGGVHTVQQKHAPSYIHHMYNVLVSINNELFSGSGTPSRQSNKTITLDFKFYYFVLKSGLITYFPSTGTRKITFETPGNCEYLRQTPTSTPTATTDTSCYKWLHVPKRPQTSPIKFLYSYSNTVVTLVHSYMLLKLQNFLEDRLALINENATGFSVETDSLHTHRPAPAVSASPVARLAWDTPSLAVCCPELSFEHSSFQVFSRPQNTHIYVMHARSCNQ